MNQMAQLVFHKVRKVWTSSFNTSLGAKRYAKQKYPHMDVGTPFRWGRGWQVYVLHKGGRFGWEENLRGVK